MTRLTEALERARAAQNENTTRLVPRSGENAHRANTPQSAWQFDEETPLDGLRHAADSDVKRVEIPKTWQIDDEVTSPPARREAPAESVSKAAVPQAAPNPVPAPRPVPPVVA